MSSLVTTGRRTGTVAGRALPRRAVALTLLVLLAALGAALLLTVPWTLLAGASPRVDVARDFTPAQVAREVAFHHALRPAGIGSWALGLLVAAVLGLTPLGARLVRAVARPFGGGWPVQVVLATLTLGLVARLVTLPLDVRAELVLRTFGLSTQTWSSWTADAAKSLAVATVSTSIGLLVLLGLVRASPRRWWAWGAAAAVVLTLLGSFVYPVLVEPAFNSFRPLAAGPLRTDLLAVAARDGVPVQDVLVADASRRTTALNAYVSGFGSTRRIVLYDTLLRTSPPGQVQLIVAHELGHAKQDDVLKGTLLGALGAAAGVCALALLLSWAPLLRRAGASGPGDAAVVPLVLALVALGGVLAAPLGNAASRQVEARADLHSLDLTGDVATFVRSEQRLSVVNLSDLEPPPVLSALFGTHPSGPERIALAREWARLHGRR